MFYAIRQWFIRHRAQPHPDQCEGPECSIARDREEQRLLEEVRGRLRAAEMQLNAVTSERERSGWG